MMKRKQSASGLSVSRRDLLHQARTPESRRVVLPAHELRPGGALSPPQRNHRGSALAGFVDTHAAGSHGSEAARRRQNMIDHIILIVSDFERSVAFYAKVLKPLGITNFTDYEGQDEHPDLKGFG